MNGMPIMKPEKLNGQTILKPYTKSGDGMLQRLESTSVAFPPTIAVDYHKQPLGALVEAEARTITGLKAMTTSELRTRLHAFALLVIENERRKEV